MCWKYSQTVVCHFLMARTDVRQYEIWDPTTVTAMSPVNMKGVIPNQFKLVRIFSLKSWGFHINMLVVSSCSDELVCHVIKGLSVSVGPNSLKLLLSWPLTTRRGCQHTVFNTVILNYRQAGDRNLQALGWRSVKNHFPHLNSPKLFECSQPRGLLAQLFKQENLVVRCSSQGERTWSKQVLKLSMGLNSPALNKWKRNET